MADEPIVKDDTGRAAIDRVLKAVTSTQEQAGMMRGGQEAEAFAREVTERQVKIHEEKAARQGIDELKAQAVIDDADMATGPDLDSSSSLDRWDIPDDAVVINRTLDGPGATPAAQKHMLPDMRPMEDRLLEARLQMLAGFPEWKNKLTDAWLLGEQNAIHSGSDLDRISTDRRFRFAAAEMMKVVEQSNAIFGDYRYPDKNKKTKLMLVPLGPSISKALSGE
jgi:hypothetical protein